jgi:DNA-binding cell septation regulator SpoVG
MKDGTYRDLIHPIDKPTRQMLESRVLDEYERVINDDSNAEESVSKPKLSSAPDGKVLPRKPATL